MMFHRLSISPEEWIEALVRVEEKPRIRGITLPKLPTEDIQAQFVGSTGAHALREAANFYLAVRKYCQQYIPDVLRNDSRILDFGTGWGRIQRFFLYETKPTNIFGIDVDPEIIQVCRECIPSTNNFTVSHYPPTMFSDETFDLIVAYSVFSHLPEHLHSAWLVEFNRILKPGGTVFVTTHSEAVFDTCAHYKSYATDNRWYKALANAFDNVESARARYKGGEFVFAPTGGGQYRPATVYGDALFSEKYVRNNWGRFLNLVSFTEGDNRLAQNLIIARKRRHNKQKVFIIGWQKTGTTSLQRALEYLGYRILANVEYHNALFANACCVNDVIEITESYDGTKDYPWSLLFKELHEKYRDNAKFILSVRESEEWIDSLRRHVGRNPGQPSNRHIYGFDLISSRFSSVEKERIQDIYENHNLSVRNYFANKPNQLLEINLSRGQGWKELCGFLGRDLEDVGGLLFPRENAWR